MGFVRKSYQFVVNTFTNPNISVLHPYLICLYKESKEAYVLIVSSFAYLVHLLEHDQENLHLNIAKLNQQSDSQIRKKKLKKKTYFVASLSKRKHHSCAV